MVNKDTVDKNSRKNKVKHLKSGTFYTDDWDTFSKVLLKDHHVIGKAHTVLSSKTTATRITI